jgi:hypothetical protein
LTFVEICTYVDVLLSYVSRVFGIGPISVHVLNGSINSIRIVGIVAAMNVFTNFHVEKLFGYFEIGQEAFVVI